MLKKLKNTLVCCTAAMLLAALPVSANAADEVRINDAASVAVGESFTYSMYISDASDGIMGMQAYVFYDTDYLEIDTASINFETLNGVIYNGNLNGYMTFNFSDITNYADFSSRSQLTSMNFKVKKAGDTNITYFIREMYGSDTQSLTAYTFTYDILTNGKALVTEQTPVVESSDKYINTYQGNFINYIDGKGNDNTDEKTDHKAIIGERTTMVPQNPQANTQYIDVEQSGTGTSVTTFVIICGVVLLACAIGGVMYFRHKENLKNGIKSDSSINDNDMTESDE
ncbi:MAG: cohesin domain-containing protein [Ruminococcus sp.]